MTEEHGNTKTATSDSSEEAPSLSLDEFRAELDVFSGPLDLLLHLIKNEEVDVREIPISRITDRYLTAMKAMQMFDINLAAEFLVMAATLMDLKSRSLLPDPISSEEEEDDPEDELIHQLLEYKKFKQQAGQLQAMADQQAKTYRRRPPAEEMQPEEMKVDTLLNEVDIWDCVSAYAEIIRQIELNQPRQILYDEVSVGEYMEEILETLEKRSGEINFLKFFDRDRSRPRIIGVFLALLELLRQGKVQLAQNDDNVACMTVCRGKQH